MDKSGTNYFRPAEPEELDADMLPDDLIDILERLKFNFDNDFAIIKIDSGVRDYLVSAVRDRR